MKRIDKALLVPAMVLAACSPETPDHTPSPIAPEYKAFIETVFDDALKFWDSQGVSLGTKLVIFSSPDDRFNCERVDEDAQLGPESIGAEYCPGNDTVVVPDAAIRPYVDGDLGRAAGVNIIHHEIGHAVQNLRDPQAFAEAYTADAPNNNLRVGHELDATCLAGYSTAESTPEYIEPVADFMGSIAISEELHGGTERQTEAFLHGANVRDCEVYTPTGG